MILDGKVFIVTGAGSGIGRATAVRMLHEGACVVFTDRDEAALNNAVAQLTEPQISRAAALVCDVTNAKQCHDAVEHTYGVFGALNGVVANAGITRDATVLKMNEADFDSVIAINLKGVFNTCQATAKAMVEKGDKGALLVTSSIVGLDGNFGQTNYAAAKAGVIGMVKTWSRELGGKGIRANAVCPGFINTPMAQAVPQKVLDMMSNKVPMKRLGQPEEVADLFCFLGSDKAAYINGSVIEITGGLTL